MHYLRYCSLLLLQIARSEYGHKFNCGATSNLYIDNIQTGEVWSDGNKERKSNHD